MEIMSMESAPRPCNPSENRKKPAKNEPRPLKSQVVGWPPIRVDRKQTLAKPTEEMYVKVKMDGITVGRKIALNANSSYAGLYLALEEMFQLSKSGGHATAHSIQGRESHIDAAQQKRLLTGSNHVLAYEDQDGDWMMVGDVPWGYVCKLTTLYHTPI